MHLSPPTSPVSSPLSDKIVRPHHPPYHSLILKLFDRQLSQEGSFGRLRPMHLTTIKKLFWQYYSGIYWFPANWNKHLYVRLREMERKGSIASEGRHNLYFKPVSKDILRKRHQRVPPKRKRLGKRNSQRARPTVQADTVASSTNSDAIEQILEALKPYEEARRIEDRLSKQLDICRLLLQALCSDTVETAISAVQEKLDALLREEVVEIGNIRGLEESVGRLKETLWELQVRLQSPSSGSNVRKEHPELFENIAKIEAALEVFEDACRVSSGNHLLTLGLLVAALLGTVKHLQATLETSERNALETEGTQTALKEANEIISRLEGDLGRAQELLKLRSEQVEVQAHQFQALQASEISITRTMEDISQDMMLTSRQLSDQLYHEETMISEKTKYHETLERLECEARDREQELLGQISFLNETIATRERQISKLEKISSERENIISKKLEQIKLASETEEECLSQYLTAHTTRVSVANELSIYPSEVN